MKDTKPRYMKKQHILDELLEVYGIEATLRARKATLVALLNEKREDENKVVHGRTYGPKGNLIKGLPHEEKAPMNGSEIALAVVLGILAIQVVAYTVAWFIQ